MLWMADERKKLKASSNATTTSTPLSFKDYGEMWKDADESTKAKYQELANKDKTRYEREMEAFKKTPEYSLKQREKKEAAAAKKSGTTGKRKSAPRTGPKKTSGYFVFCSEKRPELLKKNPTLKVTESAKELGALWQALDLAQKNAYNEKAKKLNEAAIASAGTGAVASDSKKLKAKVQVEEEEDEEDEDEDVEEDEEAEEEDE